MLVYPMQHFSDIVISIHQLGGYGDHGNALFQKIAVSRNSIYMKQVNFSVLCLILIIEAPDFCQHTYNHRLMLHSLEFQGIQSFCYRLQGHACTIWIIDCFVQLLVVYMCVIFLAASNVFWLIFCIQNTLVKTLYGPNIRLIGSAILQQLYRLVYRCPEKDCL